MNGNTATTVSPGIEEHEMRDFFNRLVNAMMEKTKLAQDVEQLKARLEETNNRVTHLVSEASNLRSEVYTLSAERNQARREAEENKKLADMFSADLEHTKATLTQVKQELVETRNSFYDSKSQLERAEKDLERVQSAYTNMESDRDYWRTRSLEVGDNLAKSSKELTDTKSRLAKVEEFYRSFFTQVNPVEPKPVEGFHEPIPFRSAEPVHVDTGHNPGEPAGDNTGVQKQPTGYSDVPPHSEPQPEETTTPSSEEPVKQWWDEKTAS